jgi:hypothetical protein
MVGERLRPSGSGSGKGCGAELPLSVVARAAAEPEGDLGYIRGVDFVGWCSM